MNKETSNTVIDLSDRQNCFYWQTDRNLSAEDYERIFLHRHEFSAKAVTNILLSGIASITNIKSIELIPPDENVIKGNVNIVRKVVINGMEYVVRLHPRGVKNGYFYVEQQALSRAKTAGVPVPEILEVHESQNIEDVDFVLMTASSGITVDVFLQNDKSGENTLLVDCGKRMAQVHEIEVKSFGSFNNTVAKQEKRLVGLHKTYDDFVHVGLEENLERLIKFDIINRQQAEVMNGVFEINHFEPPSGPRLIHNDFADWNLLTDGKGITAVLDWDECHAGDPIADLACWSTFFNIERMNQFMKGYTSLASLPNDYDERFHFYRLRYTISKMALRIKRYQVDKSPFILEKLEVGKQALNEEAKWFGLS